MTDIHSIEDLRTLGAYLRDAREERALSLEEVESQTRIRLKFLMAIENGDFSILPSATHAKGFLRNYAQYLQLDTTTLINRFSELTGEEVTPVTQVTVVPRPETPLQPVTPPDDEQQDDDVAPKAAPRPPSPYPTRPSRYVTPSQRVGPAGPTGLGQPATPPAEMGTTTSPTPYPGIREPQQEKASMPSLREASVSKPEAPPSPRPVYFWQSNMFTAAVLIIGFILIIWWTTSQLSRVAVDGVAPTETGSEYLGTFAVNTTQTPTATFEPTSTPNESGGPIFTDRVLLTIEVQQRTWARITVDGEVVFEGMTEVDSVLQYEGQETVKVLVGNGAAFLVTYNGRKVGVLGERGEVVLRIYTVQSQLTPTYTPTVTSTPTSVPTSTPRQSPTPTPDAEDNP